MRLCDIEMNMDKVVGGIFIVTGLFIILVTIPAYYKVDFLPWVGCAIISYMCGGTILYIGLDYVSRKVVVR